MFKRKLVIHNELLPSGRNFAWGSDDHRPTKLLITFLENFLQALSAFITQGFVISTLVKMFFPGLFMWLLDKYRCSVGGSVNQETRAVFPTMIYLEYKFNRLFRRAKTWL